jgi:hypothetical protein
VQPNLLVFTWCGEFSDRVAHPATRGKDERTDGNFSHAYKASGKPTTENKTNFYILMEYTTTITMKGAGLFKIHSRKETYRVSCRPYR